MAIKNEAESPAWLKIRTARRVYMQEKLDIEEEIRRKAEIRLMEFETVLAEAIIEGYESGLSQSAIGRAYGTKDYRTIKKFIDRAGARRSAIDKLADINPESMSGWKITGVIAGGGGYVAEKSGLVLEFEVDRFGSRLVLDPNQGASGTYVKQPEGTDWIFEKWIRENME